MSSRVRDLTRAGSRLAVLVTSLGLVAGNLWASPAYADKPGLDCLYGAQVQSFSVSAGAINLGDSITVSWSATLPPNCSNFVHLSIYSVPEFKMTVPTTGTVILTPNADKEYQLLVTSLDGTNRSLARRPVTVAPPPKEVTISSDTQADLFVRAVEIPNTVVRLWADVNLNLTPWSRIDIAAGVRIFGGRTSTNPGARLYVRDANLWDRTSFLVVAGDNVRISGVRIDGGNMGIVSVDTDASAGIRIASKVNIEVDNSEIYGWYGMGVWVVGDTGRVNIDNATAVRVHDNFIHHNRRYRSEGYGVAVGSGAYAVIENNVFDYNRHAIEAGHQEGTGYLAYRNLVLTEGGQNSPVGLDTHMLDVHGSESCGGKQAWCGRAGEYFDYRYNTIYYNDSNSITVRGRPTIRADVTQNVFWLGGNGGDAPIYQTDGDNLQAWNNLFGVQSLNDRKSCDFDGDGEKDEFLATGITWWYKAKTGWRYLNTSTRRIWELSLRDADKDGRCDVITPDLTVFSGGRSAPTLRSDLWWSPVSGRLSVWKLYNSTIHSVVQPEPLVASSTTVLAAADFNADQVADLATRTSNGIVQVQLLDAAGKVDLTATRSTVPGVMPLTVKAAGSGDFNGDSRADLVWRHPNGELEIWFAGERGNAARPTHKNEGVSTSLDWQVKGLGDFNGDGRSDIVWRHANGQVTIWYMDGAQMVGEATPGGQDLAGDWQLQAVGTLDGNEIADILWRHRDGSLAIWLDGSSWRTVYPTRGNQPGAHVPLSWQIIGLADTNQDRRSDIIWRDADGTVLIWEMDGARQVRESEQLEQPSTRAVAALSQHMKRNSGISSVRRVRCRLRSKCTG
ncbi:FG-GAP-like repeat-containing protein [Kribbella sp. NBC_01505]|uniref:right-handed parallel beta-helix repeat-containing protein n=1 Tax=Kribbella sp. NBC_01505 TaxID=2903580 RepID=UPI00386D4269